MQKIDLSDFNPKRPCHNKGAPFENTVLDEEGNEKEGYESGLELGRKGQFYQAGGPHVSSPNLVDCKHWDQMVRFERKNNAAWKRGWKRGQAEAKIERQYQKDAPIWEWIAGGRRGLCPI